MGHTTDIFSPEPAASCICAICHDVLEDAASFKECGHTFCDDCIKTSLRNTASCPNCRAAVTESIPAYVVRDIVGAMQVRCPEWNSRSEEIGNKNKKRKRCGNDEEGNGATPSTEQDGCNWEGSLKDLKGHENNACGFKMIVCSVDGCGHSCHRKDMDSHISSGAGILTHMELMKTGYENRMKAMEQKFDDKIANIQSECDEKVKDLDLGMKHFRYVNDCRSWIEYKPDALIDFSIHQIKSNQYSSRIAKLLCGIPGPTGSEWEGSKIPMTLDYTRAHGPPKCKFPAGFFHPNIYPSGTIYVSTLDESIEWTSETSLPEILFTVQQLLSHPTFMSPTQLAAYNVWKNDGPDQYQLRVREEAKEYSGIVGCHPKVPSMLEKGEVVDKVEITERAEMLTGNKKVVQQRPTPPSFERDSNGKVQNLRNKRAYEDCECSCCAWGQVFWDEKRKMRFLFGSG